MIRTKPAPPLVTQSKRRVRAWLESSGTPTAKIATDAGVDEKTIRLAITKPKWNPTADTLAKLEALIPHDWRPDTTKRARAA